jgi:ribonuclease PH
MNTFVRSFDRSNDVLRPVVLERGISPYAEGSCLIKSGNTHVLCTASVDEKAPSWLRGKNSGWVTAEYAMLPRATRERTRREVTSGRPTGRSQEIQRLIGRSLRGVTNLSALGERQIVIDCDVIQADGGTRTAAITGAWVALYDALAWMYEKKLLATPIRSLVGLNAAEGHTLPMIAKGFLKDHVAAVSCGLLKGTPVLDLDYNEDSTADVDANFVMTGSGRLIEIQGTAEGEPFSESDFSQLLNFAKKGISHLVHAQKTVLEAVYG